MEEGNVNGRDQDSVFSSEMGSIEAGAVSLMGYVKEGWVAVEREREEMREMKLKLKQRNSPKSTPRKKRHLGQLAAVPGSESGKTDDATEKLDHKHDVLENASRWVESVSTKQRDVRRSERKIVKMLAPSELKKKEENMYRRNKGLTDDEIGSTEKNGNEERSTDEEMCTVVTKMERKDDVEEDASGWEHKDVNKQKRKVVKKLRSDEAKTAANIYSWKKGICDVDNAISKKNDNTEEAHPNIMPRSGAFQFVTVKTGSNGDRSHRSTISSDFDIYKSSLCVKKDEIWAMYDEHGMPRHCAKVLENGPCYSAKVRFLRFYDTDAKQWYKESGALRTCGIFVPCSLASSWASRCDATAFSHKLFGCREEDCGFYDIHPRKGEIWAITTGFNSTPFHVGSPTIQRYQIVEVLENFDAHTGTIVGQLSKVEGSCRNLFQRCKDDKDALCLLIPPADLERFSHQIPFFHVTGEGTCDSCFELDSASLPLHIEGVTDSLEHENDETYLTLGFLGLKISWQQVEFGHGKVWAVYDDLTRMPQKYVLIQYFYKPNPESRIKMTLLKPCDNTKDEMKGTDIGFPIACGDFVMDETFDTDFNLILSHPVLCELEPKPCEYGSYIYKMYPRKGDIWGVYRNFDLEGNWNVNGCWRKLQYEIVEIVREYTSEKGTEVLKLVREEGFKCLFRRGKSKFIVPRDELYRFSHQIPAYKFEAELGQLSGLIILDPLLVPEVERDYFTFADLSLLEALRLKPLRAVLQYLMGRETSTFENKGMMDQQSNLSKHVGLEVKPKTVQQQGKPLNLGSSACLHELQKNSSNCKHLRQSHNSDRKEELVGVVAEMTSREQQHCRKVKIKNIKTKVVKSKTTGKEEQAELMSSVQTEAQLISGYNNARNDPEGNPTRGKKQKFILDKGNASDVGALLSKAMAEKGLPSKFCQLLPENDCTIVLQDEEGQVFETVYLARRTGLSGGWRGFSIAHQLVAGDALVFQLVEPRRLKVYIIRANSCGMSDGVPESQK